MYAFIARFLGTDAEAKAHLNNIAHVAVEYEKASVAIRKAEAKFLRVRENKVSTFRNLKKSTFDRTFNAVSRLIEKVDAEEKRFEEYYATAAAKISNKRESIDRLHRTVTQLDFSDPA